jgi:hypothetical protein
MRDRVCGLACYSMYIASHASATPRDPGHAGRSRTCTLDSGSISALYIRLKSPRANTMLSNRQAPQGNSLFHGPDDGKDILCS